MSFPFRFGGTDRGDNGGGESPQRPSSRKGRGASDLRTALRGNDERIIRLQQGDEDAFVSIFREYVAGLLTFAWRHVGSRPIAEEIVQEIFFDLWERRATLDASMLVRAYLYQAVRYRIQNRYRTNDIERRYHERMTADLLSSGAAAAPEQADDRIRETELQDALSAAMQRIPPRSREVFILNREHHLSYVEIAETLGISIKTVEVHMGRALAHLRRHLSDWMS